MGNVVDWWEDCTFVSGMSDGAVELQPAFAGQEGERLIAAKRLRRVGEPGLKVEVGQMANLRNRTCRGPTTRTEGRRSRSSAWQHLKTEKSKLWPAERLKLYLRGGEEQARRSPGRRQAGKTAQKSGKNQAKRLT